MVFSGNLTWQAGKIHEDPKNPSCIAVKVSNYWDFPANEYFKSVS